VDDVLYIGLGCGVLALMAVYARLLRGL